jgi:nucleoside-diphosphate-sugar epimerase
MPEDEPGIAHMVPDVIKKCLALPDGAPLPIFGDGTQTRTLTHIDDIADGIVTAMSSPSGLHEDFNISAGDEMTVAEIARVIWEECGRDPEAFALEHLPTFPVDVVRRWPSVEKARTLLGWEAQIDVRQGVAQTVQWLRERVPAADRG